LHLSSQGSGIQPLVDISPLISTPVNQEEYPNYASDDWYFVLQPSGGRAALSSMPIAISYPLPDPGVGGELENSTDLINIDLNMKDIWLRVNPKNGNPEVSISSDLGFRLGTAGCVKAEFSLSYTPMAALSDQSINYVGINGIGMIGIADDRLIIPNPTPPGAPDYGITHVSASGVSTRYAAVWVDQGPLPPALSPRVMAQLPLSEWSLKKNTTNPTPDDLLPPVLQNRRHGENIRFEVGRLRDIVKANREATWSLSGIPTILPVSWLFRMRNRTENSSIYTMIPGTESRKSRKPWMRKSNELNFFTITRTIIWWDIRRLIPIRNIHSPMMLWEE
jgi:hypothetical protein